MTKIFYDTEFLEDGHTIELISIGMINEQGDDFYAINEDINWKRVFQHSWLRKNVVPHLDLAWATPYKTLAVHVEQFILSHPEPELWAWYGAYDHVALCQLWGPAIAKPVGIPHWTNDLRQEFRRLNINPKDYPSETIFGKEHNALDDAKALRRRYYRLAHMIDTGFTAATGEAL